MQSIISLIDCSIMALDSIDHRTTESIQTGGEYLLVHFSVLGWDGCSFGDDWIICCCLKKSLGTRKEQAILGTLGFSLEELQKMNMHENMPIIIRLCLGVGAGLLGVLPIYQSNLLNLSFLNITIFCVCLIVLSFLCLFFAVRIGLRQIPFDELRHE